MGFCPRAVTEGDWHEGHGFVFQCYEGQTSWSDFLVASGDFSVPSVEVELGGQALELWPLELFVPVAHAAQALDHFLEHGRQNPSLEWIRVDKFPREVLWESRAQAWQRVHPRI